MHRLSLVQETSIYHKVLQGNWSPAVCCARICVIVTTAACLPFPRTTHPRLGEAWIAHILMGSVVITWSRMRYHWSVSRPICLQVDCCVPRRYISVNQQWTTNSFVIFWLKYLTLWWCLLFGSVRSWKLIGHGTIHGTVVRGSRIRASSTGDLRRWNPFRRHTASMFLVHSVYKPGLELGLSRILQLHTHCNKDGVWRIDRLKTTITHRAITQSLITSRIHGCKGLNPGTVRSCYMAQCTVHRTYLETRACIKWMHATFLK